MSFIITKAQLDEHHACDAYLRSPEWDPAQQALVFTDWPKSVAWRLSTRTGTHNLDWLVAHKLVPMTKEEFIAARSAARAAREAAGDANG